MRPAPRTLGSLISSRESTSPSTPRTSAETRSTRTDTSGLPVYEVGPLEVFGTEALQLALLLDDLGVVADEPQNFVQRRLGEAPIVPHQRHADRPPLPQVVVVHLGDRRVELAAHQVLDAAQDHALVLERMGTADKERDPRNCDRHLRVTPRSGRL